MKSLQRLIMLMILVGGISAVHAKREGEKEGHPDDKARWRYEQRAYPYTTLPANMLSQKVNDYRANFSQKSNSAQILAAQPTWRQLGPFNVGGRVRAVVHHPTKDGWVYIGAAGGGVWRTTDGGDTWTPLMDFTNSIEMGALAMDPNNPDILYAGTGEYRSGSYSIAGAGIFKTTDAGATWRVIGLTNVGGFSKIYVHPKNSNLIYAGGIDANAGFYKSTDAGETWKRMNNGVISDISLHPDNPDDVIVGIAGENVFQTLDGGETWTNLLVDNAVTFARISVQRSPANLNKIYMLAALSSSSGAPASYISTNGGKNWLSRNITSTAFGGDPSRRQGDYDNFIMPHTTDEKICLLGGVDLFYTDNNASLWQEVAGYDFPETHPDMHCAAYNPMNPNIVYLGCDGGMYKSTNKGYSWFSINNNLPITQYHGMAVDHSKGVKNYGGTQDNGTISDDAIGWGNVAGGDGSHAIVNSANPDIIWGGTQYGGVFKRNMKTGDFASYANRFTDAVTKVLDQAAFVAPLEADPNDPATIYSGRRALWVTFDNGTKWTRVSPYLTQTISAVGISPADPDASTIWIGGSGELFVTSSGGGTKPEDWTEVTYNGIPNRFVSDIECSRVDKNTAFVTFSGFNSSHVYKTTDLGKTWKDIGKGLPDVPCNSLIMHPDDENIIFVGTDFGVYVTYNGGETWAPYGIGLPNSMVVDMMFYEPPTPLAGKMVLRVATHGRSMWEIDVPNGVQVTDAEITAPTGGEIYTGGTNQKISWYGFTPPVKIEYSLDNGLSWTIIAGDAVGNSLRWNVPNKPTFTGKIRVSSTTNTEQTKISPTFTIELLRTGSVIAATSVSHIPYGIAYDSKNGLWTTSFGDNKLVKLNATTLNIEKVVRIEKGDSLFTDLSFNKATGTIYLQKFVNTESGIGFIYEIDTTGKVLREFNSPGRYPIGIEIVNNTMITSERDGDRNIYTLNMTNGAQISKVKNPFNVNLGPRCICYDGKNSLFQASTAFPGNVLQASYAVEIPLDNLSQERSRFELVNTSGIINARGIEYDPRDKNFWVTSYGGDIFKIGGWEITTNVGEEQEKAIALEVYPNPFDNTAFIGYNILRPSQSMRMEAVNLLGQTVQVIYDGPVAMGNSGVLRFDRNGLPAGVYSLIATFDDGTKQVFSTLIAQ